MKRTLTAEAKAEIAKLRPGTVAADDVLRGIAGHEPLLFAMDGMLRYARAYQKSYGRTVREDSLLGDYFRDVIRGIRGLLNGPGAVAMEQGIETDSKNNGVIESLYWLACKAAGLDGDK
jgi:hypothetical protein